MTSRVAVTVAAADWNVLPRAAAVARRAAAAALATEAAAGELGVLLTDDARMRALNRDWRGRDETTDVLSFAVDDAAAGEALLGDVVVAAGSCLSDAKREGRRPDDHLAHLVVHGTLHVLGYDHATSRGAAEMEALERRVLAGLGIADPYGVADAGAAGAA